MLGWDFFYVWRYAFLCAEVYSTPSRIIVNTIIKPSLKTGRAKTISPVPFFTSLCYKANYLELSHLRLSYLFSRKFLHKYLLSGKKGGDVRSRKISYFRENLNFLLKFSQNRKILFAKLEMFRRFLRKFCENEILLNFIKVDEISHFRSVGKKAFSFQPYLP